MEESACARAGDIYLRALSSTRNCSGSCRCRCTGLVIRKLREDCRCITVVRNSAVPENSPTLVPPKSDTEELYRRARSEVLVNGIIVESFWTPHGIMCGLVRLYLESTKPPTEWCYYLGAPTADVAPSLLVIHEFGSTFY